MQQAYRKWKLRISGGSALQLHLLLLPASLAIPIVLIHRLDKLPKFAICLHFCMRSVLAFRIHQRIVGGQSLTTRQA